MISTRAAVTDATVLILSSLYLKLPVHKWTVHRLTQVHLHKLLQELECRPTSKMRSRNCRWLENRRKVCKSQRKTHFLSQIMKSWSTWSGLKFYAIFNTASHTLALLCNRQIPIKHLIKCLYNTKPSTSLFPNPHSSGSTPNVVAPSCLQCCRRWASCCLQTLPRAQAAGLVPFCQKSSCHLPVPCLSTGKHRSGWITWE